MTNTLRARLDKIEISCFPSPVIAGLTEENKDQIIAEVIKGLPEKKDYAQMVGDGAEPNVDSIIGFNNCLSQVIDYLKGK